MATVSRQLDTLAPVMPESLWSHSELPVLLWSSPRTTSLRWSACRMCGWKHHECHTLIGRVIMILWECKFAFEPNLCWWTNVNWWENITLCIKLGAQIGTSSYTLQHCSSTYCSAFIHSLKISLLKYPKKSRYLFILPCLWHSDTGHWHGRIQEAQIKQK